MVSEVALDHFLVAVSVFNAIIVVSHVAFIAYHRNRWLPFRCKSLKLLSFGVAGGLIWVFSSLVVNRHIHLDIDSKTECIMLMYFGQLLFGQNLCVNALIVRLFRLYYILVRKQNLPRRTYHSIVLLMIPTFVVAIAALYSDGAGVDDGMCVVRDKFWAGFLSASFMYPYLILMHLSWSTRKIRTEFNEYKVTLFGGVFSMFISIVILVMALVNGRGTAYGRAFITFIILVNVNYFYWSTIGVCFVAYMRNDQQYLYNFRNLVKRTNPDLFGSNLEDLLCDQEWRQNFKMYALSKYCGECVEFWEALLVREELIRANSPTLVEYTNEIIADFIVPSSPHEINISQDARDCILRSQKKSDPGLFEKAKEQIYLLMNTNLFRQYLADQKYERWVNEEQRTRLENELLREQGIIGGSALVDAEIQFSVGTSRDSRSGDFLKYVRIPPITMVSSTSHYVETKD